MSFRGVEVESVRSDLVYSNLTWRLPNLVARRPEGEVRLALRSHTETQDFHFDFRSSIDPHAITPALEEEKQKKGFDYFSFETPPVVEGQVWGRWRERERTGFRASVAATNFTFRAQQVDGFTAGVSFANGFLSMTNAVVRRPEGEASGGCAWLRHAHQAAVPDQRGGPARADGCREGDRPENGPLARAVSVSRAAAGARQRLGADRPGAQPGGFAFRDRRRGVSFQPVQLTRHRTARFFGADRR